MFADTNKGGAANKLEERGETMTESKWHNRDWYLK